MASTLAEHSKKLLPLFSAQTLGQYCLGVADILFIL
jgi:hypothetical protein